jgi:hypothetical protein
VRWRETLEALDDVAAGRVLPAREVHTWCGTGVRRKHPGRPRPGGDPPQAAVRLCGGRG